MRSAVPHSLPCLVAALTLLVCVQTLFSACNRSGTLETAKKRTLTEPTLATAERDAAAPLGDAGVASDTEPTAATTASVAVTPEASASATASVPLPVASPRPPSLDPEPTPEPEPEPEPRYVIPTFPPGAEVDLLLVVDNSPSMGDKQALFRDAVPKLIELLTNPPCSKMVSGSTFVEPVGELIPSVDGRLCESGQSRMFSPIKDLHIGVISSSLGDHGLGPDQPDPPVCPNVSPTNDAAHLIALRRDEATREESYNQLGFLVWDHLGWHQPPGDTDLNELVRKFQAQVSAVGENGCSFEAPLEAAYRFLIDPEPHERLVRVPCNANDVNNSCVGPEGIDAALLAQRAAFLRPDSQLVVIYLSDENDCSIRDRSQGYHTLRTRTNADGRTRPMIRSTDTCQTDPNAQCCHSCAQQRPSFCDVAPEDNGCDYEVPAEERETDAQRLAEAFNVRCFDQKRRFGVDFLYPIERYLEGFTQDFIQKAIDNPAGKANPLFSGGRRKDQVFVAGIVGTPWQDVAVDWQNDPSGKVERAVDLNWDLFLPPNGPTDPFNIESIAVRSGPNPVTGAVLGGPGTSNAINGHDREIVSGDGLIDDLQFACTFPLAEPRNCESDTTPTSCDCVRVPNPLDPTQTLDYTANNPLCRNPETGEYGMIQYFAKAYPGTRFMRLLQGMRRQGLLTSICPKNAVDPSQPDYGYRPALRALLLSLISAGTPAPPERPGIDYL